jgi:hypothetical protein
MTKTSKFKFLVTIFILVTFISISLFAQQPNLAYRLPVSEDMPEFAKKIYQENTDFNVFELDKLYKPWKEKYLAMRAELKATETPSQEQLAALSAQKTYYKYYGRWRYGVEKYIQADGTLDFTKDMHASSSKSKSTETAARMSSTWSFIGPKRTFWARNDNADIPLPLAPWQSNIYSLDVAPSNTNILVAGGETGVVNRSTDKGLNWTAIGRDNSNLNSGVGAVAIHPSNPDIFYVGNNTGLHRTNDAGTTWTHDLVDVGFNTNDIKIHPTLPDIVLAGGNKLTRRTAGPAWSTIINRTTYDISFKPGDPNVVYALISNAAGDECQFFKSTDAGLTFTQKTSGWVTGAGNGGGRMAVTSANADVVYCFVLNATLPKVLKSTDAGETWSVVATGSGTDNVGPLGFANNGQGFYDMSITASQTNADHVIVGVLTAYKSTDGGVNYTAVGGYWGPFSIHPDIQEMVTVGSDSYIATDGGVNHSTDFWTNVSNYTPRLEGLSGTQMWGYDQGWNEDVQVGGRYHNGNTARRESYPPGSYLRMGGAEQATGYVNPGNPSMTYFSDLGGRILPDAYDKEFKTFSVTKWPNELYYNMQYSGMFWDPTNYNTYYIGKDNILWKTIDNGLAFTALFTHADAGSKVMDIDISRSNPNVMYCTVTLPGNDGELWKSVNAGISWTKCANPGTLSAFQRTFSDIEISGTNENEIWLGFNRGPNGQKIFKSTDGGATWTNLTTSTLDGVELTDIEHQLGTNGGMYLNGTNGKIFYRNNTLPDWVAYNTGIPGNLNSEMSRINIFYRDGKLRNASTNGIWEVDLYEPSTTTLVQPMANARLINCVRDTVQLESYSVTNGSATYAWTITPTPKYISSTSIRNPKVVLAKETGLHSVKLDITDSNGTTSRTITDFFNVPNSNLCYPDTISGKMLTLTNPGDNAVSTAEIHDLVTNTVTMSGWVKPEGSQTSYAGIIFDSGSKSGLGYSFGNHLGYIWNGEFSTVSWYSSLEVPQGVWSHVAVVITPTNATVYLNGIGQTHTHNHVMASLKGPFHIGNSTNSSGSNFKGSLDEISVYNRALTQNEIRELMHLTRNNPNMGSLPASDATLISYYQFNEDPSELIYDNAGGKHATIQGAAVRNISTAPVGGGTFEKKSVSFGDGIVDFSKPGVELVFDESAADYPDGDVIVTRLNVAPDQLPAAAILPNNPFAYYIIRNYGANSNFDPLLSMKFKKVGGTNANMVTSPAGLKLYKRASNAHGATWGSSIDNADVVTNVAGIGTIEFSTGLSVSSFSQFSIENRSDKKIAISNLRIQGAMPVSGTTMTTALHAIIPLTDPYGVGVTATSIPADAVDWVKLELRSGASAAMATTVVGTTAGFLYKNGTVKGIDGNDVNFNAVADGNYYLSVSHRNHLKVITNATLNVVGGVTTVDFATVTLYSNPLILTNGPTTTVNGVVTLWGGDANTNGKVSYIGGSNDKDAILDQLGFSLAGQDLTYQSEDVNMNAITSYNGGTNDKESILEFLSFSLSGELNQHHP